MYISERRAHTRYHNTRKMISSGGHSVITLVFESLSLLPQYAIGRYMYMYVQV